MPQLTLASASPRRAELLAEAGFVFDVVAADVDEDALSVGVGPRELPRVLAEAKAKAVEVAGVVLAADTVAYAADGTVLGKPTDAEDCRRMLRMLADTQHKVVTGFCVRGGGRLVSKAVKSDVIMRPLTDADIDAYVATGQWRGKAGGYGIQDEPGTGQGRDPFVERLEGELTNVIGLPMPQVIDALADFGIFPRDPS